MKVSFEKVLKEEGNIFELTKLVIHRAKKISYDGSVALSGSVKFHKPAVLALMELDEGLITLDSIKEDVKSQMAIQASMEEIENLDGMQKDNSENIDDILPMDEEIIISAKQSDGDDAEEEAESSDDVSPEDELEEEVVEEIHSHD